MPFLHLGLRAQAWGQNQGAGGCEVATRWGSGQGARVSSLRVKVTGRGVSCEVGSLCWRRKSPQRPTVRTHMRACMHTCMQVVLLNLLIAIMSDTHSRVRDVSQLVALYERAKLVLEQELELKLDAPPSLHRRRRHRRRRPSLRCPSSLHALGALLSAFCGGAGRCCGACTTGWCAAWPDMSDAWCEAWSFVVSVVLGRRPDADSSDRFTPRWLHVLMAAEQRSEEGESTAEVREVRQIRSEMAEMRTDIYKSFQKVRRK